ncbi:helix-turn-helix transcriptional regulator [Archangium violaceum]|uniref:helix-turn-helix domain-containing protein n=1 Tax=Archangium violaceum TaxID=83451 RepID=UPI00193BD9A1|nr:helix-turn-helix transcriptional regulator [Archangium violaceum]QRK08550.1 helix-turn-helix transcriptional regulator [Archangium violaceum]
MTDRAPDLVPLALPLEEVRDTLARNLSAARSALGLSQDQLAAAGGVSRATINQLEGAEGDPRLSTLVGLAAALGVSPVFLLLGRDELDAIAKVPGSKEAKEVQAHLTPEELDTMRRLLRSGVAKNRTKAVAMGSTAVATAGVTAGALAAAAIGTALLPGIGTAIGAAFAASWLARKKAEEEKDDDE